MTSEKIKIQFSNNQPHKVLYVLLKSYLCSRVGTSKFMDIYSIIFIAVGLAMDSFAVCISKSVCRNKFIAFRSLKIALVFGVFQGLMPLIGYFLGLGFSNWIKEFDHWLAFVILGAIGIKMVYEGLQPKKQECDCPDDCVSDDCIPWKTVFLMAFATSIDALATGLIFVPYPESILSAVSIIGAVSFVFTFVGMFAGTYFGKRIKFDMTLIGGIILIGIGAKIFIEHLFFA